MSWKALAALLVMVFPLLAACDGGNGGTKVTLVCPSNEAPAPPLDLSSLSLDEVYRRMAESMTCPGYALHVTSTQDVDSFDPDWGTLQMTYRDDVWIDMVGDMAREDFRPQGAAPTEDDGLWQASIVLGGFAYLRVPGIDRVRGTDATTCAGTENTLISLLLQCVLFNTSVARFEHKAEYDGGQMPAVVTEGKQYQSDWTVIITQDVYLDESTLLPAEATTRGVSEDGPRFTRNAVYRYDFVPLDSLPQDLFDPSAIGYVEPDPEKELRGADLGIDVYWLGRDFAGTGGLPALSLESAKVFPQQSDMVTPGYSALLDYRLASEKFGYGVVGLQLFSRSGWDAYLTQSLGANFWDEPCVQKTETKLDERWAVVFGRYESLGPPVQGCPDRPPDRWGAYVYTHDMVILVSTSAHWKDLQEYVPPASWKVSEELVPSPYNSREGMEAIVRGLVQRPPD